VATGPELQDAIKQLHQGSGVNVVGFLARANSKSGEYRLVLHAFEIEPVASASMV
jgi:primosomal replication protein N